MTSSPRRERNSGHDGSAHYSLAVEDMLVVRAGRIERGEPVSDVVLVLMLDVLRELVTARAAELEVLETLVGAVSIMHGEQIALDEEIARLWARLERSRSAADSELVRSVDRPDGAAEEQSALRAQAHQARQQSRALRKRAHELAQRAAELGDEPEHQAPPASPPCQRDHRGDG